VKKSILVTVFAILFVTTSAFAGELNLACIYSDSSEASGFATREVIVGESENPIALKRSSKKRAKKIKVSKYAVVIKIIPGEGNNPAREEYQFSNLVQGYVAICSINHEAHANPALSGGN
jgi:hypothetical protein